MTVLQYHKRLPVLAHQHRQITFFAFSGVLGVVPFLDSVNSLQRVVFF